MVALSSSPSLSIPTNPSLLGFLEELRRVGGAPWDVGSVDHSDTNPLSNSIAIALPSHSLGGGMSQPKAVNFTAGAWLMPG